MVLCYFFFEQKTSYEMRISDCSSDVCSSDLLGNRVLECRRFGSLATGRRRGLGGRFRLALALVLIWGLAGDLRSPLGVATEEVVRQQRCRHDDGRTDCDQSFLQNA